MMFSSTASCTASSLCRSWRSTMARSGDGCAWRRCAGLNFAAAITITPFEPADWRSFRGCSRPSIREPSRRRSFAAARSSSTCCSAAACAAAPARCSSVRLDPGSPRSLSASRTMRQNRASAPPSTLLTRAPRALLSGQAGSEWRLAPLIASGDIDLHQINPAEMSPGEFTALVCRGVTEHDPAVVVIDSLNGYLQAMPQERFLALEIHLLLSYLNQHGVLTISVMAQHGLVGVVESPIDLS